MKKLNLLLAACMLFILSCEKEKTTIVPAPDTLSGIFIVNEGTFNQGNGEIAFISTDSSYVNDHLYATLNNNQPLGDVINSMTIYNGYGFIAANNSQKVVVVSMTNFKKSTVININSPRYCTGVTGNSKVYVSDWSDNTVKVVDIRSMNVKKSIPAGNGPEQMCIAEHRLFVTNVGGLVNDSTVTVIDVSKDSVIATITTGVNPNSICRDQTGKVWVLCGGSLGPDYIPSGDDIAGQLLQIDPLTLTITKTFTFGQQEHPIKMQFDPSGRLVWLMSSSSYNGEVYTFLVTDVVLPSTPLIAKTFYGIGIDLNSRIYCGSGDFTSAGYAVRYTPSGTLIDSIKVGIAPNSFVFNQ